MRAVTRTIAIIGATLALLQAPATPALAYTAGQTGFDISYPQCSGTSYTGPLPGGSFAVIGVTGGRAYSRNACFSQQYAGAATTLGPEQVSFYMNLNAAIGSTAANGQTGPKGTCGKSDKLCLNYNYGYNAAANNYAAVVETLRSRGIDPTHAGGTWWLDIETANSWHAQTSLNVAVIQGATDYLTTQQVRVGIYSTPYMWNKITGSWRSSQPVWYAGTDDCAYARARSATFTNGTVVLVQAASNASHGDRACAS